jgi:hypothetical protein
LLISPTKGKVTLFLPSANIKYSHNNREIFAIGVENETGSDIFLGDYCLL